MQDESSAPDLLQDAKTQHIEYTMEQVLRMQKLAEMPPGEAYERLLLLVATKAREEANRMNAYDELAFMRLETRAYAIELYFEAGALLAACDTYCDAPQYERQELRQRTREPLILNGAV